MNKRPSYIGSVEQNRPRTIYFYATSHCNSNCSYCVFRTSNLDLPRVHMPLSKIKDAWFESSILRTCGIVVQGGEFTLHPEALGIMMFFSKLLPKVTLLTNAVDPLASIPLVEYATQVTVSLDGPQHDRSRGVPGNLNNVFKFMDYLKTMKIPSNLQITLGPWNARNVQQGTENVMWFLDKCMEYGTQPRFNIASDDGLLGIAKYEQKTEVLTEIFTGLISLSKRKEYEPISKAMRGGSQYIMAAITKMNGHIIPCYSTSIYSTIGADGSVWLCQGLDESEAVVGNIHDDEFDKIWYTSTSIREDYRMCQRCTLSCQLTGDLAYLNSMSHLSVKSSI